MHIVEAHRHEAHQTHQTHGFSLAHALYAWRFPSPSVTLMTWPPSQGWDGTPIAYHIRFGDRPNGPVLIAPLGVTAEQVAEQYHAMIDVFANLPL